MSELDIKEAIINALTDEFKDYAVRDFPINLSDYNPIHVNGEILVKSLGYRPVRYLSRDNKIEIINYGEFAVYEYTWRIDLICKKHKTQDELFEITDKIIDTIRAINIDDYSRFVLSDVAEALYDEEKFFQFRVLTFILITNKWLGD